MRIPCGAGFQPAWSPLRERYKKTERVDRSVELRNGHVITSRLALPIEYATTGKAGGHIMDGAPESVHQPAQQLGSY